MKADDSRIPDAAVPASPENSFRTEVRRLVRLGLPIVGTTMSGMLLGFTDFVMVSRLGTEATAAISPCTMLLYTVLCLGLGMSNSVQTFSAQALGRRNRTEAPAYAWQALYIAAAFAVITYPVTLGLPRLWEWVGHEPIVAEMELAYSEVVLWCMPLAIMCVALEGFFNGVQRPKVALASVIIAVGFNALANYALIFGKLGFPEMGIRGAAVATLVAWLVRLVVLYSVFRGAHFRREYDTLRAWRPSIARIKGILKVGGPTGIQWTLDVGSWFVFLTLLLAGFGTATLAASNIGLQLMHLSFMAALGIGSAVTTLVGHAIGERRHDLAELRARVGLVVTTGYMGFIGVIFLFFGPNLVGLLSGDPVVIAVGSGVLIWAAAFQVFDAMGITYVHALRGAGDTRWPALVVIFCNWGVFISGGYAVSRLLPQMSHHGPWMMCTLYIILVGLALRHRFRRGAWRKIELFGPPEALPPEALGDVPTAVCDVEQVGVGA